MEGFVSTPTHQFQFKLLPEKSPNHMKKEKIGSDDYAVDPCVGPFLF